jgi:hypothetical protein
VIPAAILFVVLILIAFFIVMGDLISDWIDETIWGVVNRRITRANPHLRPETLEQMTRRAWEEYQRRAVS